MGNTTTVLIVDDHSVLRSGLRALLQCERGITVVGEAADGRSALRMIAELAPDVVIMDFCMPEMNGIDAARQAIAKNPNVKVIGLSALNDEQSATKMLQAGAVGYLAKVSAYEEVVAAIRTVVDGKVYFSPEIVSRAAMAESHRNPDGWSAFKVLSSREREVLQLVAEGKSTKEAASLLKISIKTVETHRRNLMAKLSIDHVAGLTKYAIREGLTTT